MWDTGDLQSCYAYRVENHKKKGRVDDKSKFLFLI